MLTGGPRLHLARHREKVVVLPCDLGDRKSRHVDLLGSDEMQQEIQRPLERVEAHLSGPEGAGRRRGGLRVGGPWRRRRRLVHGRIPVSIFMAARTSSIVFLASIRARRAPSARMSCTRPLSCSTRSRRSWIGRRTGSRWLRRYLLQSIQPIPPRRHSTLTRSNVAQSEDALCRSLTGQTTGS